VSSLIVYSLRVYLSFLIQVDIGQSSINTTSPSSTPLQLPSDLSWSLETIR